MLKSWILGYLGNHPCPGHPARRGRSQTGHRSTDRSVIGQAVRRRRTFSSAGIKGPEQRNIQIDGLS